MNESMFRQSFAPGAPIFREGEPGECAYVIAAGRVQISALRGGREVVLAELDQGELFGEMALLDGQVRSATATATTDTTLVVVHREQVDRLVDRAEPLLNLFVKVILERLRTTNSLVDLRGGGIDPLRDQRVPDERYERLRELAMSQLNLEQELRRAVEKEEFELYYQPIVATTTCRAAGFEALIRWHRPDRGLVSPGEFVPLAEHTGLVVPIGRWALEAACAALPPLHAVIDGCLPGAAPTFMSVNLSARQIADADIVQDVARALEATDLPPEQLKLEVTESVLMDDPDRAVAVLTRLKALGVRLAVDDFGTGYSSLSYLRRFPIDVLKIDRSFVSSMLSDSGNLKIVRAITRLASELGMAVIAEGVERQEELTLLRDLECEFAQGFLFARPLPLSVALATVTRPLHEPHPVARA